MRRMIDIPDDIAAKLRAVHGDDFTRSTIEELALSGYSDGTLSRFQVQRLLGFDNRWDTENWLGSRGVSLQYSTADLDLDRTNLDRIFKH